MNKNTTTILAFWNGLPMWAKGFSVVAAVGIPSYIGYTIYKNQKAKKAAKIDVQESESASADLKILEKQGIKPTMSNTQIDNIIAALVEAMNDCGTDENGVYNQFKKLNNIADVYALIKRWEIRYYRVCAASSPISYIKYLFNDKAFGGNLSTWLTYDLSATEIGKINKILSDKGIKFKF